VRGARFARDNAYSAAPTALKVTIIDVPALPGWADVWRTALRASTMRYPAHCLEWSKVWRPALGADVRLEVSAPHGPLAAALG